MASLPSASEPDSLAGLSWEWHEQICPRALTPLAGDFLRAINASVDAFYEQAGVPFRIECRIVNGYAYAASRLLGGEDEVRSVFRNMRQIAAAFVARAADVELVARPGHSAAPPHECLGALPTGSLAEEWSRFWQGLPRAASEAALRLGMNAAIEELIDLYAELWPDADPAEATKLVQGRPSRLHQVQRDLHRLAESARATPDVVLLIVSDPEHALDELGQVEGGREFLQALRAFLDVHGHLGPAYCDLAAPIWAEEPARLLHELQGRLLQEDTDPEVRRQRLEAEAEALAQKARAALHDRPEALRRFEEGLATARAAAPRLEAQHSGLEQQGMWRARRLALTAGRCLVDAGVLAEVGDVFFLHAEEIGRALREPYDLRPLASARRPEHQRWAVQPPPRFLREDAAGALEEPPTRAGPPGPRLLRGTAAGGGRVRGPARIVVSETDFPRVQKGDVLVCPTTAPSWVPLFDGIAGLVTNTGGLLCHAAILAREFGVPAVVGARDATRELRDGQWVEVDGSAGTVRPLP